MTEHRHVFVGGLHRSGTTLFARCLAQHPDASGFIDTGATEDEGQHLQSVYPPGSVFGGPGKFGYDESAHLTEHSPLVSDASRGRLDAEWSAHWDMSKPVLVEKSPPNLIRTRFLQALYPEARQIVVMRHPIAVACATQKWSWSSYTSLIEHWLVCHELLIADAQHLPGLLVVRYEEFVADPDGQLARALDYVGLDPVPANLTVRPDVNESYFRRWTANRGWNAAKRFDTDRAVKRFEERVGRFGYSMSAPGSHDSGVGDSCAREGGATLMARERGAANDNYSRIPAPIARLGKAVVLSPRRVTASRRQLPGFLVIGTQRGGTTSLYRHLVAHPQVESATPSKGVHYFDREPEKSLNWYRAHFPLARDDGHISGEGSPYYLFHPLVPARVATALPEVRVIAILRDPVERAYSSYKQEYARGFEDAETFEQALELEPERLSGEEERIVRHPGYQSYSHQHHAYVGRGMYLDQLKAWRQHVPAERTLVLQTERFSADPASGMRAVFQFLGLEPVLQDSYRKYNARPYADMKPDTRERLAAAFAEPNRRLYEFLGEDFGWSTGAEGV